MANADALTGRTIGHYAVNERLGQGGMGIVYRAIDTRLNRPVALKVLPPDLVSHEERRRRFVHEAQTASALNHPNIVTIHDIDSVGGDYFIVMELVDGGWPIHLAHAAHLDQRGDLIRAEARTGPASRTQPGWLLARGD